MENKKLIKFLLKDLSELEELVAEKDKPIFDELEMEFLQTRVSGAKRMLQILFDRENSSPNQKSDKSDSANHETIVVKKEIIETKTEPKKEDKIEEAEEEVREEVEEALDRIKEEADETEETPVIEVKDEADIAPKPVEEKEIEMDDEEIIDANNRLGDSFLKEKSVNDLMDIENTNVEQKISNRPVESIKKSIGINDKFQYIRELFEGNAERFVDAVTELDEKNDMNEAVDYLKKNYKWKKNETSLKFINLVKRRFNNE